MNEYEQAIWDIRVCAPSGRLNKQIKSLQKLVFLNTPMKVKNRTVEPQVNVMLNGLCPKCGKKICNITSMWFHDNEDCGQALDWS